MCAQFHFQIQVLTAGSVQASTQDEVCCLDQDKYIMFKVNVHLFHCEQFHFQIHIIILTVDLG